MLWSRFIQPRLISFACGTKPFMIQRTKIVPLAKGNVLEIGIGSGLNIPLYNKDRVKKIIGVDPSTEMQSLAKDRINESPVDIKLIYGTKSRGSAKRNETNLKARRKVSVFRAWPCAR